MSDPLRVIRNECVALEKMLTSLGGTGSGLGEKAASVDGRLGEQTRRSLRQIAALRNRVMHEGYEPEPEDMQKFWAAVNHSRSALADLGAQASGRLMTGGDLNRRSAQRSAEATEEQLRQEVSNHTVTRVASYLMFLPFCYMLLSGTVYRLWQQNMNLGFVACLMTVALLGSFVALERAFYTGVNAADKLHAMSKYNAYGTAFWAGVFITFFTVFLG